MSNQYMEAMKPFTFVTVVLVAALPEALHVPQCTAAGSVLPGGPGGSDQSASSRDRVGAVRVLRSVNQGCLRLAGVIQGSQAGTEP